MRILCRPNEDFEGLSGAMDPIMRVGPDVAATAGTGQSRRQAGEKILSDKMQEVFVKSTSNKGALQNNCGLCWCIFLSNTCNIYGATPRKMFGAFSLHFCFPLQCLECCRLLGPSPASTEIGMRKHKCKMVVISPPTTHFLKKRRLKI